MGCGCTRQFANEVKQIELHRKQIDVHLQTPALWTGKMRRELVKKTAAPEANLALAHTFNWLHEQGRNRQRLVVDVDFFKKIHKKLTGEGVFRHTGVRIGRFRDFPYSKQVEPMVAEVLQRANTGTMTTREICALHLDLLSIHPFSDGNGRTIRLLCSYLMLYMGYRSTLFTAFEQHYSYAPKAYGQILHAYRSGRVDKEVVIGDFLKAIIERTKFAAWFFLRKQELLALCANQGMDVDVQHAYIARFDTDPLFDSKGYFKQVIPMFQILGFMSYSNKLRFRNQLLKIKAEIYSNHNNFS